MILVIDNYDSFVHNLARYFVQLGQDTVVRRNDAISLEGVRQLAPAAIILSPGPCTPDEAGICREIVAELAGSFPILGVCLGHQAIVAALGGRVIRAGKPMHGRASAITHRSEGLFDGLPSPFQVGRYHSLIVEADTLPESLQIDATAADGTIMAVSHREWPLYGVQFHPESVLTEYGYRLLANFLKSAGLKTNGPALSSVAPASAPQTASGNSYWEALP